MANIAARLDSTGKLYTNSNGNVGFNEISQSNISITLNGVFAYTLDEYTGTENGKAMQDRPHQCRMSQKTFWNCLGGPASNNLQMF